MDSPFTQTSDSGRGQLERQLQKLVRATAVLGYCRHRGAIDAVSESILEVELVLDQLHEQAADEIDERTLIETQLLLTQARKVTGRRMQPRYADANVVEMRGNYSDLADAEFERMLAASDIPILYSSTAASESMCFGPGQANDENLHQASNKNGNKQSPKANHLSLVKTSSDQTDPNQ